MSLEMCIRDMEGTDENPGNWYWFEGNFEAYQANRIERLGEDLSLIHIYPPRDGKSERQSARSNKKGHGCPRPLILPGKSPPEHTMNCVR